MSDRKEGKGASTPVAGQERLAKNVFASFAGHFVFIILGFIMPRLIDAHVGQAGLGVWDFAWTVVSYLSLTMVGIGSSVNRFVAKFRAENDVDALGRMISTVIAIQLVIASVVLLCSLVLSATLPVFFAEQLGDEATAAGWVVALLGGSLAVQMAFDAWRGVLSGCHRWDYYNAINAGGYALTATTMIIVLQNGGGLRGIATAYLVLTAVTEITRFVVARKVCPELSVSVGAVNKTDGMIALKFGVKTTALGIPGVLVSQTVNVFIIGSLGPAVLAVLSRPLSLVSHISTLMNKYTFVLTPMAGSIQPGSDPAEVRVFAEAHARTGWVFAIPPLVYLFMFGDSVLELWMGADYAVRSVTAILAAGYLLPISQSPILRILIGMNEHGRIARTSLVIAASVLPIGILVAANIGWTIQLAAALVATAIGLSTGANVLYHGFAVFGWTARTYFRNVFFEPLRLLVVLLALSFLLRHFLGDATYGVVLISGAALTTAVFAVMQRRDMMRIVAALLKKKTPAKEGDQ